MAYVGGYDGILYALNLANGNDIWDARVGDGSPIIGGVAAGGGLVFVGSSDGTLYAYDATEGVFQWRFETGNSIWATPAVADGKVFFGSMDQKVYALDLVGQKLWEFHTGGAVTAEPLVQDGRVYIGSFSSDFYALDAETGSMIWKFPDASNWYWSRAVTNGDTLFVGSTDGNLYALDAATGALHWVYPTEGSIVGSPRPGWRPRRGRVHRWQGSACEAAGRQGRNAVQYRRSHQGATNGSGRIPLLPCRRSEHPRRWKSTPTAIPTRYGYTGPIRTTPSLVIGRGPASDEVFRKGRHVEIQAGRTA